jgi:GntR family transcriptional regulator
MNYIHINKLLTKSIYKQIADSIHQAIESGVLKYNDKLPTEKEICQTFRVSQTAVKMAYELLIHDGYIKRIKGKGTYVLNRKTYHQSVKKFFYCELDPTVKKRVLLFDRTNKDYSVVRELGLDNNQKYYAIIILFEKEDNPVLLQKVYLPINLFEGVLEHYQNGSIYNLIQTVSDITEMRATFSPLNASKSDGLLLQIQPDDAIYLVRTKVIDHQGRVLAYINNYYPGEFTSFEVDVYA